MSDFFSLIVGHSSSSPTPPLTTPAASQPASAVQHEREGAEEGHTDPPLNRRNNSDPNAVSQFPMYQVNNYLTILYTLYISVLYI